MEDLVNANSENTLTLKQFESDAKAMEIHKDLQNAKLAQMESYITSIIDGVKMVSGEIKSAGAQKNIDLFKMTQVSNLSSIRLLLVTKKIGNLTHFKSESSAITRTLKRTPTATTTKRKPTATIAPID